MNIPYLSIVIPVHNEQEVLEILFERLTNALDNLKKPFEIIFTNDGSQDKSAEILNDFHAKRPEISWCGVGDCVMRDSVGSVGCVESSVFSVLLL